MVSERVSDLFRAGEIVDQRYRVEKTIGEGGMGLVYAATQLNMNRRVALKVLRKEFLRDEPMVERFEREAASISKLSHPNIVTVFDYGRATTGEPYLVMEYFEGTLLSTRLASAVRMDAGEAVAITVQVLAALEHAHNHKIVHRDLKPSNVMLVDADGHKDFVKLLDFGLSKLFDELQPERSVTRSGVVVGTPAYMAPEQALGENLDGRTDLYAVGLMLYEMVSGALPFAGHSTREIMMKQINEKPLWRGGSGFTEVEQRIKPVVMKALEKMPYDRFQNARDMRLALLAEALPVEASAKTAELPSIVPHKPAGSRKEPSLARGEMVRARRAPWVWVGVTATALMGGFALAFFLGVFDGATVSPALPSAPVSVPSADSPVKIEPQSTLRPQSAPAPAPASVAAPAPAPVSAPNPRHDLRVTVVNPSPAAAPASAVRPVPTPVPMPEKRPPYTALSEVTVRVQCADSGKPCWAHVSLDRGTEQATKVALFRTRRGKHTVTIRKEGFESLTREIRVSRPKEYVTIDMGRAR